MSVFREICNCTKCHSAHASRALLLAEPEESDRLDLRAREIHPQTGRQVCYSRRGRLLVRLLGARTAERLITQVRKAR